MANGDDGYVDTGGGGSVWWKLRVSEGNEFGTTVDATSHTDRDRGRAAYVLSGHDTYAKEKKTAKDGSDYYVVTIADASEVRIVAEGNTLRLYLPVKQEPPAQMPAEERDIKLDDGRVPQIRVRWGIRQPTNAGLTWDVFSRMVKV